MFLHLSLASDSPSIQVITGAYVKPLPQVTAYEATIPYIYYHEINSPQIYHVEHLIRTGCDLEDRNELDCASADLAATNLESINDNLSLMEEALSMNAQNSFAPNAYPFLPL